MEKCCLKCVHFRPSCLCCMQPLRIVSPDTEFCSEFVSSSLVYWVHRRSAEFLRSGFAVVGDKHDPPTHSFRFMTDSSFPLIREIIYNTRANWAMILNDKEQRLDAWNL